MPESKTIALFIFFVACIKMQSFALTDGPIQADSIPRKLLYIVQVDPKNGNDFMIPYIEQKLKNLRVANQDKLLYDSVVNFNNIQKQSVIKASIVTSLIKNGRMPIPRTNTDQITTDTISTYARFMQAYDEILLIKLSMFETLIEFQFTLFKRLPNNGNILYTTSSSVFINPDKPDYQRDIIKTLDQVFDKANNKPEFAIQLEKPKINGVYYVTSKDTVILDPIIDDGSSEDDRIYFWNQDVHDKSSAHTIASKKDQKLQNLSPGDYTLYFYVSNSINYSRTDTIRIHVYEKPVLKIQRRQSKFFFASRLDRLIIQEYLLGYKNIDEFTSYTARLNKAEFAGSVPDLYIKLCDKKGVVYVEKSVSFLPDSNGFVDINHGANKIINDINFMDNPFKAIGSSKYSLSFVAKSANMESVEEKRDLDIFQRRPVSLVFDAVFSPIHKSMLFGSWLNIAGGLDLHVANFLSVTALAGTNASNNSFKHFYTNFIANLSFPGSKLEGGPAIFIGDDVHTISLGFKISYSFFQNGRSRLKIADSYYNRGLTDYYSLHLTENIFFNH